MLGCIASSLAQSRSRIQQVVSRGMVRLRLARHGKKFRPFYRIVAADARCKRDGKFIEMLGTYNPIPGQDGIKEVRLKTDRIKYWISVGGQPTSKVAWILGKAQLIPELPLPKPFHLTRGRSLRVRRPWDDKLGCYVDPPTTTTDGAPAAEE